MGPGDGQARPFAAPALLVSEFAAVTVTVDHEANGPRLHVRDLSTGAEVFLEPLELQSFCRAQPADRLRWLEVGPYRKAAGS